MTSNVLLEVKDLTRFYKTARKSLFTPPDAIYPVNKINFKLTKLRNLGIAGESGSGKTTLAKIISQIEKQDEGQIFFEGRDISKMDKKGWWDFRKAVQFIFQDPYESINPKKTVFQTLVEPLKIYKIGDHQEQSQRVENMLNEVGLLPEVMQKFSHQLSGGQRQRVAIARALMLEPKLVIADEPVSALDVSVQAQILNLLLELQVKLGITYIVISHDLAVLRHFCDDLIIYYAGNIVEKTRAKDLFSTKNIQHPYSAMLLQAAFFDSLSISENTHVKTDEAANEPATDDLLLQKFAGCNFYHRCPIRSDLCAKSNPLLVTTNEKSSPSPSPSAVACHHPQKVTELIKTKHRA